MVVIQARVDARHRIVASADLDLPLGLKMEAAARELVPAGILARGTDVRIVCESGNPSDRRAGGLRILALRIGSGPTAQVAVFPAEDASAPTGPYALDGRAVGTALLRYPVAHLRITSGFSSSRKHPISQKRKPHLGVDFAAPYGTPVVAVADGEVVHARWSGSFGRLIRIVHADEYASAYAHLQRFATGVKAGSRVTKGQVIGYVGNSGLATGPHLHFALLRNGQHIDPLGPGLPESPRLAGESLAALRVEVDHVERILAASDREDAAVTRLASATRP
jgi:murein DD-endopeptidase MepM/ murein hydrolase activator NlpD